jgi:ElaB/YqjD/DUF883 family membrane-anchored ribosome-binding protein
MAGLSGDEYASLRARLSEFLDNVEHRRASAKAAAVAYPSQAAKVLGEADAYNEVAEDLQELLATLPK